MVKKESNRPADTDFTQQRLKTRPVGVTSVYIAAAIVLIAIFFIPTGSKLKNSNRKVFESKITYDESEDTECSISSSDEGKQCKVVFEISESVEGPLYLYYEMTNFFQNHRRYYQSRSIFQLRGEKLSSNDVELDCNPLYKNGSLLLNPCGLIANSFFTDMFTLDSDASLPTDLTMDETGISLKSDREHVFKQVSGFDYKAVTDTSVSCSSVGLPAGCKSYTDSSTGQSYLYYYPDDDTVQYLYESYPDQISPIDGVTDEHFIVWMKTSSLPTFRKLYGRIDGDFVSGDRLVFNVTANYETDSFDATKKLVLSNLGSYGGKNMFLGEAYTTIGSLSMVFGVALLLKALLPDIQEYFKTA